MFAAIGFVIAIIWAFVTPYLFAGADDAALATALATVAGLIVFIGGGALLDRRRNARASSSR